MADREGLNLEALGWPLSRMVEALEAAARHRGLPVEAPTEAAPIWGASELGEVAFDHWVEASAAWLGIEVEPLDVEHSEAESLLLRASPVLLRVPGEDRLLVIVGRRGRRAELITSELEMRRVPVADLREVLCRQVEAPVGAKVDEWLGAVVEAPARRKLAREAMVRELLEGARVARAYLVRIPPGASLFAQLRFEGLIGRAIALVVAHAAQFAIGLGAWYTLASGAFRGGIDVDWLIAWAMLLATGIPVQLFTLWAQGELLIGVGAVIKRRLLAGTLRVDQDALRRDGAGQLLGRSLDASALEALALGGGLFSILSCVELVLLVFVLAAGPGGVWQALAFAVWTGITLALAWQAYGHTRRWTHARRDLTSALVEQMVGHRTRLAQQSPSRWHDGEDEALDRYATVSGTMDRKDATLRSMPQGWYVVGLCALLPTIVESTTSAAGLAIAVGAMMLGGGALARLSSGLGQIAAAATAWGEVKPLYEAAARPEVKPSPVFVASHLVGVGAPASFDGGGSSAGVDGAARSDVPLLDATDLVFSYPGRPQPVLREGVLQLHLGDRVLLEGPSGGGKSTFASLLSGLRRPESGLLLLEGLDWQTVGPDGWRRRVAAAPQFHDNHVLSDTFLFNLLMGRRWPPTQRDIADAGEVCRELGLGPLLERMPAGLMQMVGETGWRLSHGECSRLFIARALLQGARVVVLDESFAALDPQTVDECMRCVLARAPSLVVIAHP